MGPGQESAWDYPRPPRLEPVPARLVVVLGGETIADTHSRLTACSRPAIPELLLPARRHRRRRARAHQGHVVLRVEGTPRTTTRCAAGDLVETEAAWGTTQPSPGSRPCRARGVLRVTDGRVLRRRRAGDTPAGWLLRGLDHHECRRTLQGRARLHAAGDHAWTHASTTKPRPKAGLHVALVAWGEQATSASHARAESSLNDDTARRLEAEPLRSSTGWSWWEGAGVDDDLAPPPVVVRRRPRRIDAPAVNRVPRRRRLVDGRFGGWGAPAEAGAEFAASDGGSSPSGATGSGSGAARPPRHAACVSAPSP